MSYARSDNHPVAYSGIAAAAYVWPGAVSLAVLLAIVAGGSTQADSPALTVLRLTCAALLAIGIMRLWSVEMTLPLRLALSLMLLMICFVAVHLIPLPSALYNMLPGRDFVRSAHALIGLGAPALPLTLSPAATWECLLALLPPISLFAATLTIPPASRWMPVAAILLGAAASVMLGLAQRFEGPESNLYLYAVSNFGSATGFFANRNHFAALLYVAIPLIWAISLKLYQQRRLSGFAALTFGTVMTIIVLLGLAAAASRAGIFLGMLALLLSTLLLWSRGSDSRRTSSVGITFFAMIGGAVILGQFGMMGILRLAGTDPLTDYRSTIAELTLRAAAGFFPFGSGLGTFRPIYAMHEPPAAMTNAFVNHAHNDWLELWLEGGLPAAILLALFLMLFAMQCWRVWSTLQPSPRSASVARSDDQCPRPPAPFGRRLPPPDARPRVHLRGSAGHHVLRSPAAQAAQQRTTPPPGAGPGA